MGKVWAVAAIALKLSTELGSTLIGIQSQNKSKTTWKIEVQQKSNVSCI